MKYEIKPVLCGLYQENAYFLCPEGTKDALLIDPGDDLNALKRALEASGRTLRAILLTHGHFDHMLAAQPLSRITGAPVYVHPLDQELLCDENKNAYDPGCASLPCPADFEAEDLHVAQEQAQHVADVGDELRGAGAHADHRLYLLFLA